MNLTSDKRSGPCGALQQLEEGLWKGDDLIYLFRQVLEVAV